MQRAGKACEGVHAYTTKRVRVTEPRAHTSLCGAPLTQDVCLRGRHPWCVRLCAACHKAATPPTHSRTPFLNTHPPPTPSTLHVTRGMRRSRSAHPMCSQSCLLATCPRRHLSCWHHAAASFSRPRSGSLPPRVSATRIDYQTTLPPNHSTTKPLYYQTTLLPTPPYYQTTLLPTPPYYQTTLLPTPLYYQTTLLTSKRLYYHTTPLPNRFNTVPLNHHTIPICC